MGVLSAIIIGFVIGLFARFLKPGKDAMGFVFTTLLGIGGSLLGAYLGQVMGIYQPNEPAGFLGAVVGAILLLYIVQTLFGRKRGL